MRYLHGSTIAGTVGVAPTGGFEPMEGRGQAIDTDERAGASRESVEQETWRVGHHDTQDQERQRRGFWEDVTPVRPGRPAPGSAK